MIFVVIMLYFMQDRMLYVPVINADWKYPESNPVNFRSPTEYSLDFEDVTVTTEDGFRLKGWFIKQSRPLEADTILFFHENAGNIGFRLPNISRFHDKCKVNVLVVGYRGYGHSEGTPSEIGLKLDAEAVFKFALAHPLIDNSKIFVFGRSLGGAVGIYL